MAKGLSKSGDHPPPDPFSGQNYGRERAFGGGGGGNWGGD